MVQPAQGQFHIGLMGNNLFQNKMLQLMLNAEFGEHCRLNILQDWAEGKTVDPQKWDLILWDGFSLTTEELNLKLRIGGAPDPVDQAIALFNIDPDAGSNFNRQVIQRCIRGIFYLDEPLDRFLKGVKAILSGELWFSRKITSRILMETHYRRSNVAAAEAMLTGREKEILFSIVSGASNGDIAAECFISPNTVKTHLYNIYKKIGVKNRLEATLWVARYL
jgi:LuxR family transcriptional regulator of csgAB operon